MQDSYTDGGRQDGGPLPPPVVVPPDAEAGGRSTDGRVWIEELADDVGATLMDYAVRVPSQIPAPIDTNMPVVTLSNPEHART